MTNNKKFFEIKNLTNDTAEILIYGTITKYAWEECGEISSYTFAKELEKYKNVSKINLRINSPGGDVFEANAIFNLIKNFSKENNIEIIGYVDGLAASSASFLILVANKIVMGLGSLFMIHNPWTFASGNSKILEKTIERLDKVKDSILDIYMSKCNKTREEISNLMNEEKWFSAKEAVEYGFADEISDTDESLNNIKNIVGDIQINNFINQEPLKKKLEEIENLKKENKEEIMIKNLQELKNTHPKLLAEYEEEIKAKFTKDEKEKIENAVKQERERIKALEEIPILNEAQKEIINKAKYEEAREPKDIMVEFYMSNSYKAHSEIEAQRAEAIKNGLYNITASNPNEIDNGITNEICKAALETYNK